MRVFCKPVKEGFRGKSDPGLIKIYFTAFPLKLSLFLLATIRPYYSQMSMAISTKSQDEDT